MRKALIGLLITATAVTPLASAQAQSWRGGRDQARSEQRAERQQQRAERQEQRAERREQRVEQRAEPRQVRTFDRSQGGDFARGRQPQQVRVEQRAPRQYAQQNWRDRADRGDRGDRRQAEGRRWDGNRNGNYDRNRAGNWDRNRAGNWDRNRNGDWNRNRSSRDWSRSWNHNWRNDNRYDWQRYRYSHRNIYRPGRYYSPYRNHHYSRFSIGFFLEPLFYSSNYWISDPWYYRLPPAYPGTRWVRYYNDVLLVDTYSGEVVDVIYDFFW